MLPRVLKVTEEVPLAHPDAPLSYISLGSPPCPRRPTEPVPRVYNAPEEVLLATCSLGSLPLPSRGPVPPWCSGCSTHPRRRPLPLAHLHVPLGSVTLSPCPPAPPLSGCTTHPRRCRLRICMWPSILSLPSPAPSPSPPRVFRASKEVPVAHLGVLFSPYLPFSRSPLKL